MSIKIITDSASDMGMAARDGLEILPMTITFGEQEFKDGIDTMNFMKNWSRGTSCRAQAKLHRLHLTRHFRRLCRKDRKLW